jgi:hypothetical protein
VIRNSPDNVGVSRGQKVSILGDAKRKASRRLQFLEQHPLCVYCGEAASTTDHCPPRCFFLSRNWPETFEFPACEQCNAEARLDEQGLAVLIRSRLTETLRELDHMEWQKLAEGVKNNQPRLLAEWTDVTRNQIKRDLRSAFGRDGGDKLRQRGWGVANNGPLTQAATTRFMVRLGKALYYKHNAEVFDGVVYVNHINVMARDTTPDYIDSILRMAPALATVERNRKPLSNQFVYRFNHSAEGQVMYAVVQFGDQFVFHGPTNACEAGRIKRREGLTGSWQTRMFSEKLALPGELALPQMRFLFRWFELAHHMTV